MQRPPARPDSFPRGCVVAALALAPEGAFMDIVLVVAAATGGRQAELFAFRLLVAIVAADFFVAALQFKAGLVVFEIPNLPVARVVATLALRPQTALVNILLFVARPAIRFRVFEGRRGMTFLAFCLDMLAG